MGLNITIFAMLTSLANFAKFSNVPQKHSSVISNVVGIGKQLFGGMAERAR